MLCMCVYPLSLSLSPPLSISLSLVLTLSVSLCLSLPLFLAKTYLRLSMWKQASRTAAPKKNQPSYAPKRSLEKNVGMVLLG